MAIQSYAVDAKPGDLSMGRLKQRSDSVEGRTHIG